MFVHNVAAIVSFDRKELLDIRIAIAHLKLDKEFFFNESDGRDILLQTPDQRIIYFRFDFFHHIPSGSEVYIHSISMW